MLPVRVSNSFASSVNFVMLTEFGSSSDVLDSFFLFHLSAVVNFFFPLPGDWVNFYLFATAWTQWIKVTISRIKR